MTAPEDVTIEVDLVVEARAFSSAAFDCSARREHRQQQANQPVGQLVQHECDEHVVGVVGRGFGARRWRESGSGSTTSAVPEPNARHRAAWLRPSPAWRAVSQARARVPLCAADSC